MPTFTASASRDANFVPFVNPGFYAIKSITLTGSGETSAVPIFTLTGSVNLLGLWGVVTTDLGSNNTAAYWRLNDQTAQVALTAASGTTLSSAAAGSLITKTGLVATALTLDSNAAGAITEPATTQTSVFTPVILVKKTGALTQIEFVYTTNQTPTTGAIQFFATFLPLSADGNLVAA